ncbi:hypothetical protein TSMG0035 [Halocynthia phage JM-2012]|uniref:hypothetical protein n=1 Tax=Halocynthia phage JM-2012 TaxID=1173297 RepID=UPI00025C68F2|nr:hypothetical protein TSMG0035 [Halocynthia phage JM-2012]AFI55318.1 hypothetical protein TSMG0035 [Halocynthia phage JM-2012]
MCSLDLSKSPKELLIDIEQLYVDKFKLVPLVDTGPKKSKFGLSAFFIEESGFEGGLYQYLYRKFYLLDIYKATGIDFNTWLNQPFYIINRQLKQIPQLLEEKAAIMEKHNANLSK